MGKWAVLEYNETAIWGECKGSGKKDPATTAPTEREEATTAPADEGSE